LDNCILRRTIVLLLLGLFLIPSSTIIARAVSYNFNLANNVIFADDFNNYTNGLQVGCWGATGLGATGGKNGWGCNDSAATGNANITGTNFLSCCESLATWSTTGANGLFDVEKKFGLPSNSTTIIGASVWIAINRSYTNQQGNNAHLSIETFDGAQRYEGAIFLLSKINPLGNGCSVVRGIAPDFQTTPTAGGAAVDTYSNICLPTWGQINGGGGTSGGFWHHFYWSVNIITHQWVSANIDGMDFTSLVAGQFMPPHSGGDTTHNGFYSPHSFLFEVGAGNGVTHTSPADDWVVWHDDLIISDVSPTQPNIIIFGLVGYSAWIPLIMAMAGVNTTLSTWSLVIRLLKKNDGSALRGLLVAHTKMIVGMNIAVVAFLIVLIIGSIYLPGTCPAGAVCKG